MAKLEIAKKLYRNAKGEEGSHAGEDTTGLFFKFSNGHVVNVEVEKLADSIKLAALFHGLSQKIGDTYAGADSVEEAIESAETVLERLYGGEWIKPREAAGPRPSLVLDAVVAALIAAGETVSDERKEKARETLKDPKKRQDALKDARIKSHFDRLRRERMEKLEAESTAAAAKATGAIGF